MQPLAVLSCLSLLMMAAVSQKPKHCVSPPLMNGQITMMADNGEVMSNGAISYDAFGARMRVRNSVFTGNHTFFVDQLMLFKEKFYYEIDWRRFSCKKRPLDADFVPIQVPSDATLMGPAYLGSSSSFGMGILVNNWHGNLPHNGTGTYQMVFTEIGCIPITCMTYSPSYGSSLISTYNWVIGNTNPADWIPPPFCGKSSLEETETPDTILSALRSLAMKSREQE